MFKYSNKINKNHVGGDRAGPRYFKSITVKKKRILKSLIMILATVFSIMSSLIVDSKLAITVHAASNYGLTVKWTEGIEWVATDEAGTNRWTNGSIKYFAENTSAGTYIKLKPGYRLDCLAADSEWADWTTISDTLYYDSWSMYGNRTVTVKVISEVFEENGERYTYNGNYHEAGYKLVEVDSWNCTHSFEGDDIIGYIESDPSDIVERKRLNPTNEKLLASLKTYTSDSRYKIRVGSPYVKYTGEVLDAKLNELVSKYTLYVDTHNVSNETGFYPEYGADKDNDWLLASNYRCPDKDAGADADYAGFAYYRRYYAYCKDTQSWYIVGSAHNWLGCANGDTGANEFHTQEYTHTIHKYKLVESHEYTVRLNTGNIPSSELTKLTETASTEGWTWNENGRYFSKTFVQNENNYLPGVNKFFSANNYESVGSKVTDKYFVQDKAKNPTKVLYNWWTSGEGGTDIGRGKKIYNNLYEISKDNSGIVNLYPHWMGYTTVFNYSDIAPSNTAGQTVTINNNINDGMDNNLYQVYGNCFFYKGTDGEYHDYEGTNSDLKVTASIPNSNGYKYIFNGWHHKNWNYLTDGLGKLTYKNNYNIGQGKTSYSLSPHFSRVGINYNVRLNANVPDTESTLQVLHQNGISSYIYNSTSFSRELTYDDSQDMLSPDVYSLKGYHLISRSNWYTEKTGGNTVSAPCNNTEAEYPDWTEKNWNLTTTDGATVDLYARWQANNYKIAYNLDGGTYGTSHPTSADYDTMVTIDNPSKAGYTFTGWTITGYDSTTSGHNAATWTGETGTSYKNLASTEGKMVTFTATWTPVNYTISYDLNGGAVTVSNPTSYNIETPTFTLNNPVRLGYVFVGWTGSNGTTPQKAVSVYKGSTGNKSYKANWTAADVGYTINHYVMDINGNYPSTPTKTERLSGFTDTSVTAKRLSLGNGFTYPDVQTVKVKADGTTVVNYYYSRNQYYLNLNGYLKQRVSENFADLTETVKDINGKDVKHTFATAVVKINGSVHAKGNGVTDFYEKAYYGSTYEIITTAKTGYTIIDNTGTFKGTITGDTVVTPHVSINQYTVKYEPNKPSKATNDVTKMADQFVYYNRQRKLTTNTYKYTGYDFTGWNTKADGTGTAYTDGQTIENLSSADGAVITLYAQWKIHTHRLKVYVSNENADGTFGSEWLWQDKILEYNTPYSYTGYVNDTVYQQINTSGTMYDSDITIHLKAMRKKFNQKLTVYYEQPDGSFDAGTVVINKAYKYGQTVSWSRSEDVRYKAGNISWTVAGANVKELKIYRQQYKITVNGADKHVTTKGTGTYRYGYELWITAEVEAGYHFINWNMDSSLTESSMKIEVTGDKTYTAYAEANKYLITYNLNKPARASSTPKLNTQNTWEYEYNSKILYMPDKTTTLLTGWTFEGWYTEADGGTKIKVGDIYKWIGNITLYAHWTENTYTIHYESDGGTAINDINVKYEDPVKLSAVPYRPGYIFSYWNTKADASGHSYEGSETVRHLATSGMVTLYAVWSKKAIAQIGAAVNMTEKNGYVFGHITDDSVSIRTYVIDENGNITIK